MRVHIKYADATLTRKRQLRRNTVVSVWDDNPKHEWQTFSPSQSYSLITDAYRVRCRCGECLLCLLRDRLETDDLLGIRP